MVRAQNALEFGGWNRRSGGADIFPVQVAPASLQLSFLVISIWNLLVSIGRPAHSLRKQAVREGIISFMAAARSAADLSAETAHLAEDAERLPADDAPSPQRDEAEPDPAELPSFRPLPHAQRWRDATRQAPPHEAAERNEGPAKTNEIMQGIAPARGGGPSRLLRFILLAGMLSLGIGIGIGAPYLVQIPEASGGSYLTRVRMAVSAMLGRQAALPREADRVRRGGIEPRPGGIDGLKGDPAAAAGRQAELSNGLAVAPATSPDARTRSAARMSPSRAEDRDAPEVPGIAVPRLVEQAERQIADRRLERPPGDNALETYRRIAALSPGHPAATHVGERLSAAFWSLAMDAKGAERWDDAIRYLDILNTLPAVPATAILPQPGGGPAGSAQDRQADATAPQEPAPAAIGGSAEFPTAPTPENPPVLEVPPATAPSPKDVTPATGSLAFDRGSAAMRSGDVVAARRYYQISASAGIAGAATAIARTYDPVYLQQIGVRGLQPNSEAAKRWYEKAIEEGDAEARTGLNQLRNVADKDRP